MLLPLLPPLPLLLVLAVLPYASLLLAAALVRLLVLLVVVFLLSLLAIAAMLSLYNDSIILFVCVFVCKCDSVAAAPLSPSPSPPFLLALLRFVLFLAVFYAMFIYSFLTQFTVSVALPAHAHLHFVSLPRFVCVCVLQQQQQHWLCAAAADAHNQTILHSNFSPPHLEEVRLRRRQCDDDFYTISYASIALVFHNALHALARCFLVFFFRPRFSSISIAQIYKQQKKTNVLN